MAIEGVTMIVVVLGMEVVVGEAVDEAASLAAADGIMRRLRRRWSNWCVRQSLALSLFVIRQTH